MDQQRPLRVLSLGKCIVVVSGLVSSGKLIDDKKMEVVSEG